MGTREEQIEVQPGWTVAELLDALQERQPGLARFRGAYRVAVDLEVAPEGRSLEGAREIALIPPVSGGMEPLVRLTEEPIDVPAVLEAVRRKDCGATALFLGTTRDTFEGQPVEYLDYSAYEAMALQGLRELARQAQEKLGTGAVAVWHRLGVVGAGDVSVAVAVSSPHRGPAFEVARWLIDTLKAEVPLWKREVGPDGSAWVEGDARVPASGG